MELLLQDHAEMLAGCSELCCLGSNRICVGEHSPPHGRVPAVHKQIGEI